jgi:mono/diheme cytochrome c family protein
MKHTFSSHAALRTALLGLASGSLVLACHIEPEAGTLHYSLGDDTQTQLTDSDLSDPDAVGEQILGALEMLFGTPTNPRFLLTTEWVEDEEWDPNEGKDLLSDALYDEVVAGNARRFKRQLELIEARRYAEVYMPIHAIDLWRVWQSEYLPALVGDPNAADEADRTGQPDAPYDPDDDESGSWHEEAVYLFTTWYPSMRESAEMYRQQCLHCHGVEGAGDGPTAEFLEPRPRDYRQGKFKWVEVARNFAPRRTDLRRILEQGAKGSAMPSFARFSPGELEGLVDYVQLLAIRGQVESLVAGDAIDNEFLPAESTLANYLDIWEKWRNADAKYVAYEGDVPRPEDVTPDMLQHGKELFEGGVANCYTCHGLDGRGNGESLFEPDPSGETIVDADGNEVPIMRRRLDEWGNESDPRNFQRAILRFGDHPADLYRRVKYGISGTIMPEADASLSDEDVWSIVYYALSIIEDNDVARVAEARAARSDATHADDGHAEPASDTSGH